MTDQNYWTSRLGRRSVLRGGAVMGAGLAAAALVGCGDSDDDATTTPGGGGTPGGGATAAGTSTDPAASRYGGIYRRWTRTIESNFDVYMTQGSSDLFSHISERLLRVNPDGLALEPGLIQEWEVVEAGMEYILHINPDAIWEDRAPTTGGRPFDAEDVIHNILYAGLYIGGEHVAQRASWYFGIDNAEAVDDQTVRLTFDQPNAAILAAMADHRQHMVPKEVPDSYGWDNYPNFPSVGPFLLSGDYEQGQSGNFVRNPNYVLKAPNGDALPYFDGVELLWFGDTASATAAFLSDQIDTFNATPSQAVQMDGEDGVTVYRMPFRGSQLQVLNTEVYSDVRIRQAFHNLLDYKDIGDNVHLGDYNWSGPINSAYPYVLKPDEIVEMPGYNPNTREADIAEAFKKLDAAGMPEGDGLVINNVSSANTGNPFEWQIRVQGQLQSVAPKIEYNTNTPTDGPSFQRALLAGEHDAITHQSFDGPDVRLAIQAFTTGHSRNWSKFSNATVDDLVAKSLAQEGDELGETIGAIEEILLEERPWFSVGVVPAIAARNRVQGVERGGFEGGNTNDMKIASQFYWFDENM